MLVSVCSICAFALAQKVLYVSKLVILIFPVVPVPSGSNDLLLNTSGVDPDIILDETPPSNVFAANEEDLPALNVSS